MPHSVPLSADAQAINEEFKQFAYIISHDLNSPLRAMVEFARLLKIEKPAMFETLDEEGKQYLSQIIVNGERLQNMLVGLLEYSRLNTMAKPFSKVNCSTVLEQCGTVLQDKIKARKATLEIETLPSAVMDAEHCMQLFLALLDNALKFHEKGKVPAIKVFAQKQPDAWLFAVQDNGIGIDPKFHQRIFELFHRLHTDDEYPGTGTGLTLAKKIVDRHGGKIWVESEPGKGTSVKFTIPFRE